MQQSRLPLEVNFYKKVRVLFESDDERINIFFNAKLTKITNDAKRFF